MDGSADGEGQRFPDILFLLAEQLLTEGVLQGQLEQNTENDTDQRRGIGDQAAALGGKSHDKKG